MKEVIQNLVTKSPDIDLRMQVSMEGETIIDRQADSLVGNYGRMLLGMMGRKGASSSKNQVLKRERTQIVPGSEINIDFQSTPVRINDTDNGQFIFEAENQIMVVNTSVSGMNGVYYMVGETFDGDYVDLYEVTVDEENATFTQGNGVDWSSFESSYNGEDIGFVRYGTGTPGRSQGHFRSPNIVVGQNVPNTDASILDYRLEDPNGILYQGTLSTTSTSISEPAVQTNNSDINLSRTFTNNTGSAVDVGEVGVLASGPGGSVLLARDNVTDFSIANGNSVTIDYVFSVSSTNDGGVMSQFHQKLYRQFARTNRNVRDINNNDQNDGEASGQFTISSTAGGTNMNAQTGPLDGEFIGPVVGTGSESVSNTNFALETQIPHGTSSGEFVYHGQFIDDIEIDATNGNASFDIVRLFENESGGSVDVSETALYSGYNPEDLDDVVDRIDYSVMIARNVLTNAVTVNDGEIFRLTYRITVNV